MLPLLLGPACTLQRAALRLSWGGNAGAVKVSWEVWVETPLDLPEPGSESESPRKLINLGSPTLVNL